MAVPGEYSGEEFRKLLERTGSGKEREFLDSLYTRSGDGRRVLPEDISPADRKRIEKIYREMRKNRGVVQRWKLLLLAAVLAGIAVGYLLFKDAFVSAAIEEGLKTVFLARSDVDGLDFSLTGGRLAFEHLEVADRRNPMQNLFELGDTELDINMEELLKGKVVVPVISVHEIAWGTPREESGALPGLEGTERNLLPGLSGFSEDEVREFLEEQREALQSDDVAEASAEEIAAIAGSWEERAGEVRQRVDELARVVQEVRELNPGEIDSLQDAEGAAGTVRQAVEAVAAAEAFIRETEQAFRTDTARVEELRSAVRAALAEDIEYVRSEFGIQGSRVDSALFSLFDTYLRNLLGSYYSYAVRAWDAVRKLKARIPETEEAVRETGIDVPYPVQGLPKYLFNLISISAGNRRDGNYILGEVRNLSSDPDRVEGPVTAEIEKADGDQTLDLEALIDTSDDREIDMELTLNASGYVFGLDEGSLPGGMNSLSGAAAFSSVLTILPGGGAEGSFDLQLSSVQAEAASTAVDAVSLLAAILEEAGEITLKIGFSYTSEAGFAIQAGSSLDEVIRQRLGQALRRVTDSAGGDIRGMLAEQTDEAVEVFEAASGDFGSIAEALEQEFGQFRELRDSVDSVQQAVRNRIDAFTGQAESRLREEAGKRLRGLLDNL